MSTIKVTFKNSKSEQIAAEIDFPLDQKPSAYAILAHCFTCSKNFNGVRNVSHGLTQNGIAVLRFDFTGLGESTGDFSDTNFTTNIEDLKAAYQFMEAEYEAPEILLGHSLGGAAVLYAAAELEKVKAIVTIGAPSTPDHVTHLIEDKIPEIKEKGYAKVNLAGREFEIEKHFLESLKRKTIEEVMKGNRGKALLVMHSPQDKVVEIANARRIYESAHHPKSFITLNKADHLLNKKSDAQYAGRIVAEWVKKYVEEQDKVAVRSKSHVAAELDVEDNFTTYIKAGRHDLVADEPEKVGGDDYGPDPYALIASGLAACTAMTVKMYAQRKGWALTDVKVHIDHSKDHAQDYKEEHDSNSKIDVFDRKIEFIGDLSDEQKRKLLQIANKCPVHKTLKNASTIETTMQ
jgi:putative redox protein